MGDRLLVNAVSQSPSPALVHEVCDGSLRMPGQTRRAQAQATPFPSPGQTSRPARHVSRGERSREPNSLASISISYPDSTSFG